MCQISALSESEWIKWNFQFHFNLILILRLLPFSQRSVQFLVYSSTSSTGYKRRFHIGKMTMDLDHLIMKFLNRLLIEPMFFCFVFFRYGTMLAQQNYQFWYPNAITSAMSCLSSRLVSYPPVEHNSVCVKQHFNPYGVWQEVRGTTSWI